MKVLLLNGSPHQHGTTDAALNVVGEALHGEGVDTQLIWLGNQPLRDCVGCHSCAKTDNRCVFDGDVVNEILATMETCDGLMVGSPVYFAHPSALVQTVLDRVFFAGGTHLHHKPAAALTVARRAGNTASLDVLNKYFTIAQMPVVSSVYWNLAFGRTPEELPQDGEGLRILRTLGRNMAWMLKNIEAGKAAGVALPAPLPPAQTNFIR
ncbi:MAG: flavodoxin family protein [Oscillospiraceae bacterium]|nr:flavodoxin family protein [Oscillospiraceae bacterium]